MKINLNTRIKALLDEERDRVIDSLVKINSNFSKLRNPVLRNLLARRITIAEACKIAGCKTDDFLNSMKSIGFIVDDSIAEPLVARENTINFDRVTTVLELDVRPFLYKNEDPLKEILKMANRLTRGERMKIINSFEPVPLIHLLADKGFLHFTEILNRDLIITWFEKNEDETILIDLQTESQEPGEQLKFDQLLNRFSPDKIRYIDVRALEMPRPMLQIIEHVENLQTDELLYVYHKKTPVYLLPELRKKGLLFLLNRKADDELDMLIYRI